MNMKKIALFAVGGIVLLVAAVLGIGALVPQDHVASRSARYAQPPEVVWEAITDYEAFPSWRSGVDDVEPLATAGATGWVERGPMGALPLAVEESSPPRRLVLRIASDDLGFGGTWTYEIVPDGRGSMLTITENGTVTNLFFRFMSRFVFGYTATIEGYLLDLGRKLGEETAILSNGG
jgi:uncharacterized protein YndB with AHSA1/START domain